MGRPYSLASDAGEEGGGQGEGEGDGEEGDEKVEQPNDDVTSVVVTEDVAMERAATVAQEVKGNVDDETEVVSQEDERLEAHVGETETKLSSDFQAGAQRGDVTESAQVYDLIRTPLRRSPSRRAKVSFIGPIQFKTTVFARFCILQVFCFVLTER